MILTSQVWIGRHAQIQDSLSGMSEQSAELRSICEAASKAVNHLTVDFPLAVADLVIKKLSHSSRVGTGQGPGLMLGSQNIRELSRKARARNFFNSSPIFSSVTTELET